MFDFVPIRDYTPIFNYTVLVLILIAFFQSNSGSILQEQNVKNNYGLGIFLTILLILYMGLRPVNGVFGDTINYAAGFYKEAHSGQPFVWTWKGEWLFHNLQGIYARNSDVHMFFLTCTAVYVGALWLATKRMFAEYNYVPFLVILSMFTFWNYGVNGVRNGMAASMVILAFAMIDRLPIAFLIAFLATGVHSSTMLMIGAAGLAWFVKNSKLYIGAWVVCLLASFAAGTAIQTRLMALPMFSGGDDDRMNAYVSGANQAGEVIVTSMTFRWDFVAYSAMAVIVGYYFIVKRKFADGYYHWLYNIYIITNAFWLLVIRANFSNRFAQISWFVMPLVLIYPFFKERFWDDHERKLGYALLVFYAFTFYFNILKG